MYPFNLFKIHSHEVSFVFGSAGSCRGVYTHSDCDYGPSKVMPYMIPMGQFNRRPLLVHGFTLTALNTRVELPDRYAKHPKDAPLLVKRSMEQWRLCYPRLARDRKTRPPLYEGLTVAKDHLSPPANGPKTNARHLTVPPVEVCLVARLHAPLSSSWRSSCGLFSNVLSF